MDDATTGRVGSDTRDARYEYKRHLRRLAVHDNALLDELAVAALERLDP
jgi:hypothetical protein